MGEQKPWRSRLRRGGGGATVTERGGDCWCLDDGGISKMDVRGD